MRIRRRRSSTPASDAIWNRAASAEPLRAGARPGDRALHDAMELHGHVMNGGLDNGLDVLGPAVEDAAAAWAHMGRRDVAALLRDALRVVGDMPADRAARERLFIDGLTPEQMAAIEALDRRYPDDAELEQAFLRHLGRHPGDFAPPGG